MTNQIIEVPDIAVVKTVDGAKKLFSLRDQKIKKETLHGFGNGSGVKYNEDLYVLGSGIIPIVRMTTTKVDPSFTVTKSGDIEVDWGDGTREKNVFQHIYTDGVSEHNIVFYGENTALTSLNCYDNQLIQLNVTQNTMLEWLECYNNYLTQLDVTQNMSLVHLACGRNHLTQLNVTRNMALTFLTCDDNNLTQLDVSNNTALILLNLYNNLITQLDVTSNTALTLLACDNNQITQLDVSNNTALTDLNLSDNLITQLDVTPNTALIHLFCVRNPLATDQSALTILVNSLPQRSIDNKGILNIGYTPSNAIHSICDKKNWKIS